MINLHQTFGHYLHTNRKLDRKEAPDEIVISYGWTDDGKDLTGYYILTENYCLYYDLADKFIRKDSRYVETVVQSVGGESIYIG